VCRDCAKLGPQTLADLQTLRNAERLLRGTWRRKTRIRDYVIRLTAHRSQRVRAFAVGALYGPFSWVREDGTMAFAWLERDRSRPGSFDEWRDATSLDTLCDGEQYDEFARDTDDDPVVEAENSIVWDDLESFEARSSEGMPHDAPESIEETVLSGTTVHR
jgi:hypothetical protein